MLVLTRRNAESIVIGGSSGLKTVVKVIILEVRGNRVRLGIEANHAVAIRRSEVCSAGRELQKGNLQSNPAAGTAGPL